MYLSIIHYDILIYVLALLHNLAC